MSSSVIGKLVSTSIPSSAILAGVIVSVALLILLTLFHLPVSLSNCVVGAFVGCGTREPIRNKCRLLLIEIVGSWIAAPFLCALVTVLAYETSREAGESSCSVYGHTHKSNTTCDSRVLCLVYSWSKQHRADSFFREGTIRSLNQISFSKYQYFWQPRLE